MQQLAEYESDIEPAIAAIRLPEWDNERYLQLQQLKTASLEYFADGDYLAARTALGEARESAAAAQTEHGKRLNELKGEAQNAFDNARAEQAKAAVQKGLSLSPDDAQLLELQKRIAVLPDVLAALRRADVAKNENRAQKEIDALQAVLQLDPKRDDARARLTAIKTRLARQQFGAAVRAAQDALDANNLPDAQQHFAAAQALFADDPSLAPLQSRLQTMIASQSFAAQIALGKQASARDDWQAAASHFLRAKQLKPQDKTAVEHNLRAQNVANTIQRIRALLDEKTRLGDDAVLAATAAYLREVEPLRDVSPTLKKLHAQLSATAAAYSREVEVVVISDNRTHITVQGIGKVGKTARRTIKLRPGIRVFQGMRDGYKSKLVEYAIAPNASLVEVTVICDELI